MEQYPHEKLLAESGLTKKDLPSEIVNKIKEFDMKKNKRDAQENGLKSVAVAQIMYSWMEDNGHIKSDTPPVVDTPVVVDTPPVVVDTPPVVVDTPPVVVDTPPAKKKKWIPMLGWVEE